MFLLFTEGHGNLLDFTKTLRQGFSDQCVHLEALAKTQEEKKRALSSAHKEVGKSIASVEAEIRGIVRARPPQSEGAG